MGRYRIHQLDAIRFANLAGFAVVVLAVGWTALHPGRNDGYAYWNAWHGDLYRVTWPEQGYVYSPAFAQMTWPLTQLPFEAFWALLVVLQATALILVAGPALAALLMVLPWLPWGIWPNPVIGSLGNGNIMLLTAALTAYGVRYPALWPIVLLTKITPGIGLLWFAVRREWRGLGIALGLTALIAGVSFVAAQQLWFDWFGMLTHATSANGLSMETYLPLTLGQRLLIAVPLIIWGARTNRPWTVPIASMLALPAIALGGFCVGLGAIYWLHRDVVPQVQVGIGRRVLERVDDGQVAR